VNARNPTGPVGYRTLTPTASNPARLLNLHAKLLRGQAAIVRGQLLEMKDGNTEPQLEDVLERLNRHERRTVASESRAHKKALAKRDARRKARADKRHAKGLVES
jgi:hypothetical protein